MDSDSPSPTHENNGLKAEFRKPTNEAANRKYRRRSPIAQSSDEDGSPKHPSKNGDGVEDKSYSRRSSDSYKHSPRGYHHRHDDHSRHRKYADEDDRSYAKLSSRSGRESRGALHADYKNRENDYSRSRGHYRDTDRYSRDRSDVDRKYQDRDDRSDAERKYKDKDLNRTGNDGRHGGRYDDRDRHSRDRVDREEKRDYRNSRDHRSDRAFSYEESRGRQSDVTSKGDMGDMKDPVVSKPNKEGKSNNDGLDVAAKKPKFSLEESDSRKDERETSSSKQGGELGTKVTSGLAPVDGSVPTANADAAKVAAMKAAELVNQNLAGTGFMTADQKKKLLWGTKKSSTTEESSHRWDTAMFSDRERQEKFNKLMGVKGEVKVDSNASSGGQDVERQRELQLDLEKQYTAGLRRRDGRTVGLGL